MSDADKVRNWLDGSGAASDRITRKMLEDAGYRVARVNASVDDWPAAGSADHCYACGEVPARFDRMYDVWICDTCEPPVFP